MKTVFVLEVRSEGLRVFLSVHSTWEKTYSYLARYCRAQWFEQGHKKPLPKEDGEAILRYFNFWEPEEVFEIDEILVDPNE